MLANLELLAETLDGDQGEAAQSALRSSRRMRRLVADLLLLARADVGRESVREPFDLSRAVVAAAGELEPVTGEHDLTVDVEPITVVGARDDLHRVALNLMDNAIKHTPPGTHVHAPCSREGDEAVLEVVDDGPGIPEEDRERIFERFVRGGGEVGRLVGPRPGDRARGRPEPRRRGHRRRRRGRPRRAVRRAHPGGRRGGRGRAADAGAGPLADATCPRLVRRCHAPAPARDRRMGRDPAPGWELCSASRLPHSAVAHERGAELGVVRADRRRRPRG